MLKRLAEVFDADPRYHNMVVGSPPGDIRFMSLEDHHGFIDAIVLSAHVPEGVRVAFERARNAFLYAWFVYDLTPLAQSQGYAALEMALRDRLGPRSDGKKWSGLSALINEARKRGLFENVVLANSNPTDFGQIVEFARILRNELAHGSQHLSVPGMALQSLEDCAKLINHLFASATSDAP